MNATRIILSGIKRQWRDYTAYTLAAVFSIMLFFIFVSLYFHPQFQKLAAGNIRINGLFQFSAVLVVVFSAVFLWYSSALFLNRRKKDIATLLLLGMEPAKAGFLFLAQTLIIGVTSIALGIASGLLFRRLFLLLLAALMRLPESIQPALVPKAFLITAAVFLVLLLAAGMSGVISVYRYRLINLFAGSKTRERTPWKPVLVGTLSLFVLTAGYVQSHIAASDAVSISGLLVILGISIVGTFLFFGGFSFILFKIVKNYGKDKVHGPTMIAMSQLMFKARNNARFLAIVAILNAVSITAAGTFVTLYVESIQQKGVLNKVVPYSFSFFSDTEQELRVIAQKVRSIPGGEDVKTVYLPVYDPEKAGLNTSGLGINQFALLSDYRKLAHLFIEKPVTLHSNEVFIGSTTEIYEGGTLKGEQITTTDGETLKIVQHYFDQRTTAGHISGNLLLIVPDSYFDSHALPKKEHGIGILETEDKLSTGEIHEYLYEIIPPDQAFASYYEVYYQLFGVTGILLFTGSFIAIMLVLSNGSIIFFRQIMEAWESRDRVSILQDLGYSVHEIKGIIRIQQAALFGLPYILGLVHSFFALNMLNTLLGMNIIGPHIILSVIMFLMYAAYLKVTEIAYIKTALIKE